MVKVFLLVSPDAPKQEADKTRGRGQPFPVCHSAQALADFVDFAVCRTAQTPFAVRGCAVAQEIPAGRGCWCVSPGCWVAHTAAGTCSWFLRSSWPGTPSLTQGSAPRSARTDRASPVLLRAGPAPALVCPGLLPGLAAQQQRPRAGEGLCWHKNVPCVQRRLRTRGCSLELGHHSSLFYTSLCSYLFFYNDRGKNTFVISRWGETIALLTLSPPRRG